MHISLYDLDDTYALMWAEERSRLPVDHPYRISRQARDVIFNRALTRMERQCDALTAAMLHELEQPPGHKGRTA
jgi:hypothetical protein